MLKKNNIKVFIANLICLVYFISGNLMAKGITLNSPNGGEALISGQVHTISWSTQGSIGNVKIEYSTNGGSSYQTIINSTPAILGVYVWTVPRTPSNNCKVKISEVGDSTIADSSDQAFVIPAPYIIITSPNGGEVWNVNSLRSITWNYGNGETGNVRIEYSTDGGSSYTVIQNNISVFTGTSMWTIPRTPSNQCRIRIYDINYPNTADSSDLFFTIPSPAISLVNPDGGEIWPVNSMQEIIWSISGLNTDITLVKIEYSTDGGTNYNLVQDNVWAALGSWFWYIPNTPSTQCRVRISEAGYPSNRDISSRLFTIGVSSARSVTVRSPNGGEEWLIGSSKTITWTANNIANVKIEYSINNGSTYNTIAPSYPAGLGTYNWTIPNNPSTQCKIRISDASGLGSPDSSNTVFTITGPRITVTSPNGGEGYLVNSTHSITWEYIGINNIKIEYSTDGGSNFVVITNSIPAAVGSYSWLVPDNTSTKCRVRISDVSNSSVFDISDKNFTISKSTGAYLVAEGNSKLRVIAPYNSVGDNELVSINAIVINKGLASSSNSTLYFYISNDQNITTSDYLLGSTSVSPLAVGDTGIQTLNFIFPSTIPENNNTGYGYPFYYVGWIIDNNSFCLTEGPHLIHTHCTSIVNGSLGPSPISPGSRATASVTVKNFATSGIQRLQKITFRIVSSPYSTSALVSKDTVFTPNENISNSTGTYTTKIYSVKIDIPADTGQYYLTWELDHTGCGYQINDYYSFDILPPDSSEIVVAKPNLFASINPNTTVTVNPAIPYPAGIAPNVALTGETVKVRNIMFETTAAVTSSFKTSFYIGTPGNYYAYKIGEVLLSGLTSSGIYYDSISASIPHNVPEGNYYISYWIDSNRIISIEPAELIGNNKGQIPGVILTVQEFFFILGKVAISQNYSGSGNTIEVPIILEDLALKDVKSYQLIISYDSALIKPKNMTSNFGTLSESWDLSFNNIGPNKLFIEAKGEIPILKNGSLVKILFEKTNSKEFSAEIRFDMFTVNNLKALNIKNGFIVFNKEATDTKNTSIQYKYSLEQNYPNPFNPITKIRYSIPSSGNVKLKLFDQIGREVKVLINKNQLAGIYELEFDSEGISSGIYYYVLTFNNPSVEKNLVRKMIVLK